MCVVLSHRVGSELVREEIHSGLLTFTEGTKGGFMEEKTRGHEGGGRERDGTGHFLQRDSCGRKPEGGEMFLKTRFVMLRIWHIAAFSIY